LVALFVVRSGGRACAETPPADESLRLQADPRLRGELNTDLTGPTVQEVLQRLHEATGLHLTADRVDREVPAFGSLSLRNVPAWVVMEQLARSRAVEGWWDEADGGYRLAGTHGVEAPAPQPRPRGVPFWFVAGNVLLLLTVGVWLLLRQRLRRSPAGGPPVLPTLAAALLTWSLLGQGAYGLPITKIIAAGDSLAPRVARVRARMTPFPQDSRRFASTAPGGRCRATGGSCFALFAGLSAWATWFPRHPWC
jgi:hypothetical protein